MDKNKRIIWTNNNYEEWRDCMVSEMEDDETEDMFDYERYSEDCSIWLDDERTNLNKDVDGCIVAFASLGLWNGRVNGAKVVGDNVKDILDTTCGYYVTWYCDRYNTYCEDIHHDGTNHYIYRVAKNREYADKLVNDIAYNNLTEEQFRKRTKSLRPYIAKVFGW
jgi:hypothetical protein